MVEEWVYVSEDGEVRRGVRDSPPEIFEPCEAPGGRWAMRSFRPFQVRAKRRLSDQELGELVEEKNPWREQR